MTIKNTWVSTPWTAIISLLQFTACWVHQLRPFCLVLKCNILRFSCKMCCLLAGQFYHGIEFEVTEPLPKPEAIMYVKGQMLNVTR